MTRTFTKADVQRILENASNYDWELKGLGMMRTYLNPEAKLHVWDSRYKVPNVSLTHEHPWSFQSTIMAGELTQHRLVRVEDPMKRMSEVIAGAVDHIVHATPTSVATETESQICEIGTWMRSIVQCGPGGCLLENPEQVYLELLPAEIYREGESYFQKYDEIHQSYPADGTVTIVRRMDYKEPRAAAVYWPAGTEWVSSEPVMATPAKIRDIAQNALSLWFYR